MNRTLVVLAVLVGSLVGNVLLQGTSYHAYTVLLQARGVTRINIHSDSCSTSVSFIMRPSSLGGGRILRRTLSVRLSVRPAQILVSSLG